MTTVATSKLPVGRPRQSSAIVDSVTQRAVRALEDRLIEAEARLIDAEKRLKAGGL